jgi:hypothetical protein
MEDTGSVLLASPVFVPADSHSAVYLGLHFPNGYYDCNVTLVHCGSGTTQSVLLVQPQPQPTKVKHPVTLSHYAP